MDVPQKAIKREGKKEEKGERRWSRLVVSSPATFDICAPSSKGGKKERIKEERGSYI